MRAYAFLVLCALTAVICAAYGPATPPPRPSGAADQAAQAEFAGTVQPFVAKYCAGCHNDRLKTGGLSLTGYHDVAAVLNARDKWEKVVGRLHTGEMPPRPLPRPPAPDVAAVTNWIQALYARVDGMSPVDPGHLTAHRLNRVEYNNTVRDLLAIDFHPANDFPADDSGYGFDNIGDVLSVSPVLMEKYLSAAEKIARRAIAAPPVPKPTRQRYRTEHTEEEDRSELAETHRFPTEGDYRFRIGLSGKRDPGTLLFAVDGKEAGNFPVRIEKGEEKPRVFESKLHLSPGPHELKATLLPREATPEEIQIAAEIKAEAEARFAEFAKKRPEQAAALKKMREKEHTPAEYPENIEILGPYNALPPPPSDSYKRVFVCGHPRGSHTLACARQDLAHLARLAYRRPVTEPEVQELTALVENAQKDGLSIEQGMRLAVAAVLVSPHFLFRLERDPKPADPSDVHPIDQYELASRLSYFLWSSMPDEQLLDLAGGNRLHDPEVLKAQARRMLADPKADALVDNFGGQWLELRNLDSAHPDPDRFPKFDDGLRKAMRTETRLFFQSVVREDRSITDFLDAKYTFLNERLAKHYGIPGVKGSQFRRVSLEGTGRSGILTQGSILTLTSYPTRTSPVLRGKWILENVLNTPPPPPPPGVGSLDDKNGPLTGTMRQQMEKHRANPTCSSCHMRMDPLGFALENYDAVGAWRTQEGKDPIDASGKLPDGRSIGGPDDLKQILVAGRDDFATCLAEKMLTYALGRGLETFDRPAVRQISKRMAGNEYRFSSLIAGIVDSAPFQMGRGSGEKKR